MSILLCSCSHTRPYLPPDEKQAYNHHEALELIIACGAEQVDDCGDLICEGDLDFDTIIIRTTEAIYACFEQGGEFPEYDGSRQCYYDLECRKKLGFSQ